MNGSIIVKCMLIFSIVVVTHGVTRGLNAATVSFIQQRALCFRKAVELFYCDSYYAWMCLLKMSHNCHFNGVIAEIITAINSVDQTGCFLETAIISNDQTGCKR